MAPQARTIEIISRHIGTVNFTCKGEKRTVNFEDKGSVGVAMVDNDEAELFLEVGMPDFWQEKTVVVKTKSNQDTGAPQEPAGAPQGTTSKKPTVKELTAQIEAATTVAEVDAIIEGETRPSVLSVADIRKGQLEAKAATGEEGNQE